jgi:single-stranded DNA-binding protein
MAGIDLARIAGWLAEDEDFNLAVLTGTVSRDPAYGRTGGGVIFAEFVVDSVQMRESRGQPVAHTNRIDVRAYGEKARPCCEELRRGMRVAVHGSLDFYEDVVGEQRRSALRVAASEIKPIGRTEARSSAHTDR